MLAIAALFLILFLVYKFYFKKKLNIPGPSPLISLPYIGHGYLLGTDPIGNTEKFRKKYGDVFRLDIGGLPTVFVSGWKLIEEGLRSPAFAGRPYGSVPAVELIRKHDSKGNPCGPSIASGPVWQEQRKFMLHNLNDLGMGNNDVMEAIIVQEAEYLTQRMIKLEGQKITMKSFFLTTANNVIWRIITGKGTKQDDPELAALTQSVSDFFQSFDPGSVLNLIQFSNVTFLKICHFLGIRNIIDMTRPLYDMVEKEVRVSKEEEGSYFVHRGWAELERRKDNAGSSFHGNDGYLHVVGQMFDFFVAGTETVSTAMNWTILYMIHYPEIQERIHRDIKNCCGINGSISVKDTFRLPFVEATIEEIMRHSPEAALLVPHATVADTVLDGHVIPKGTQIFFFAESVHKDPELFPDPHTFNPDRFIDKEGILKRSEHHLVFGGQHGRRKCVGERLARAEYFILFASLMQKFKFSKARKDQVLHFTPNPGLAFFPTPFDVVIEQRR